MREYIYWEPVAACAWCLSCTRSSQPFDWQSMKLRRPTRLWYSKQLKSEWSAMKDDHTNPSHPFSLPRAAERINSLARLFLLLQLQRGSALRAHCRRLLILGQRQLRWFYWRAHTWPQLMTKSRRKGDAPTTHTSLCTPVSTRKIAQLRTDWSKARILDRLKNIKIIGRKKVPIAFKW